FFGDQRLRVVLYTPEIAHVVVGLRVQDLEDSRLARPAGVCAVEGPGVVGIHGAVVRRGDDAIGRVLDPRIRVEGHVALLLVSWVSGRANPGRRDLAERNPRRHLVADVAIDVAVDEVGDAAGPVAQRRPELLPIPRRVHLEQRLDVVDHFEADPAQGEGRGARAYM